jgi:hypothetical protein
MHDWASSYSKIQPLSVAIRIVLALSTSLNQFIVKQPAIYYPLTHRSAVSDGAE